MRAMPPLEELFNDFLAVVGPFDFGVIGDDIRRPPYGFRFGKGHFKRTGQGVLPFQGIEDTRLVFHAFLQDVHGLILIGKGDRLDVRQGLKAMAYTIDIGLGRTVFEVDRDFDLAFEIFSKIVEIGHEGHEDAQDEQG